MKIQIDIDKNSLSKVKKHSMKILIVVLLLLTIGVWANYLNNNKQDNLYVLSGELDEYSVLGLKFNEKNYVVADLINRNTGAIHKDYEVIKTKECKELSKFTDFSKKMVLIKTKAIDVKTLEEKIVFERLTDYICTDKNMDLETKVLLEKITKYKEESTKSNEKK